MGFNAFGWAYYGRAYAGPTAAAATVAVVFSPLSGARRRMLLRR